MKTKLLLHSTLTSAVILLIIVTASAQGTWTKKADFGGIGRYWASGFSIGTKGYIGLGYDGSSRKKDLWEWDQTNNSWTQKADFGGAARDNAVGFSIGAKGYFGTGGQYSGGPFYADFWEYDPAGNTWVQKANFPGAARLLAVGFSVGTKGYIGTGWSGGSNFYQDFWEYDPTNNSWTARANFPGGARDAANGFSIGTKGYIGNGDASTNGTLIKKDFYEWDQATNVWTQKADVGGVAKGNSVCFSIGNKGYIGTGNSAGGTLQELWEWDQAGNSWSQAANYGGGNASSAAGFAIGGKGYIGTSGSGAMKDFWEFTPPVPLSGTWTQKASLPVNGRQFATGLSIGADGYWGLGNNTNITTWYNDFWKWNSTTNVWTQQASFPGAARGLAVSFSIGNKGYIGTGAYNIGSTNPPDWIRYNDLWEYDASGNTWVQKANLPSTTRYTAVGFSIGTKGYIGTGFDATSNFNDFWEWDQATNVWTQKANFTGASRRTATGFSIGTKGYIGMGCNGSSVYKDFYEWDQSTNTWTKKADLAAAGRWGAIGFSFGGKGYVGTGNDGTSEKNDFWEWDPGTNAWTQRVSLAGPARECGAGFAIGLKGYIATGSPILFPSYAQSFFNDFWEFSICTAPPYTVSQSSVSCSGANDGSATISPTGGQTPFTYSWNTNPVQTTASVSNLAAGNYVVIVTDAAGCSATSNINITGPSALAIGFNSSAASCNGVNNGSATANVSGGTPSYAYNWNTSPVQTTQSATGLSAGIYDVIVTDANSCTAVSSCTVTANTPSYSISFSANPQAGTAPLTVAFANNTPNPGNYNFTWYFGDGSTSNSGNPTVFHTYQFNGLYDVVLVATSIASGCSDTLTKPGYILTSGGAGCTHNASVTPTGPISKCQGDTVVLSCNTDPTFTYQWNINSIAISGETDSTLVVTQSGYYSVTIFKNTCPVSSAAVHVSFVTNPQKPYITSVGTIVPCQGGSVTLTSTTVSGCTYLWSPGGQTTKSITITNPGPYMVTVTNGSGCTNSNADTVSSGVPGQQICMVTVDSTSTKNRIVWSKPVSLAIDSFKIYREIGATYKHVGSVAYSALSEFVDNTSGVNPKITAYKYKITVQDSCGDESLLSAYHRTIHLAISPATPCGYNLFWNDYIGFPVTQYRILRDSVHSGWKAIDSVSFGTTSWTDINCYLSQDTISYMLEVEHPNGCVISIKDPFVLATNLNLSRSNVERNHQTATSVVPVEPVHNDWVQIFPNPSQGIFSMQLLNPALLNGKLVIRNMLGENIYESGISRIKSEISVPGISRGVYFLHVSSSAGNTTQKLVIE